MSLTTEETAWRNHLEGLDANSAAQASKRVLTGAPQGTPETDYQTYHSGLDDDDAREESEFQVSGSIIDRTVVPNGDHDLWIDQFDNVVEVPFTNGETMFSICRKKTPQI